MNKSKTKIIANFLNRKDYLKYNYFIIRDFMQDNQKVWLCDKKTFYYLNINDKILFVDDLLIKGKATKKEFEWGVLLEGPTYFIPISDSKSYKMFAKPKIENVISNNNALRNAFKHKSAEEIDDTFKLVGAFETLEDAKKMMKEINDFVGSFTARAEEIITEERLQRNCKLYTYDKLIKNQKGLEK